MGEHRGDLRDKSAKRIGRSKVRVDLVDLDAPVIHNPQPSIYDRRFLELLLDQGFVLGDD